MSKQDEFFEFARFCLETRATDFDQSMIAQFVDRNANSMSLLSSYLVNVRYSPHLLREFVFRHWNAAISAPVGDDALAVVVDVMNAVSQALTAEERDRAWYCIVHNYLLPLPIARKLCAWLEKTDIGSV